MAPTSRAEPTKHIALHNFLKQQHLFQQRLKPAAVLWSWPVPRPTPNDAADDADGASWPPRSYTCAFCRREFRSAQALGGHMNVHRRDRAKLRGQYGAAPPAAEAAVATTEYAVLYPVLNSNAAGARAVFVPNGDVLLSAPVALASSAAHGLGCHIGSDDENEKDIDLELRLGWP
ncbi:unnamed protein product [Alopecurus aequalis]